jgi:hypothetical protein
LKLIVTGSNYPKRTNTTPKAFDYLEVNHHEKCYILTDEGGFDPGGYDPWGFDSGLSGLVFYLIVAETNLITVSIEVCSSTIERNTSSGWVKDHFRL